MSKYFWEAIEQNLKGQKPTRLGAEQLMECMGAGWSGKKESIDEVCGAIKEMSSIYETDAKANRFLKSLDEATSKICEVMASEGYNPKADDITIIASSKKIEGKEVDEVVSMSSIKSGTRDARRLEEKKKEDGKDEVEEIEEDSTSYKSKLSLLAKKRKEKMGSVDEKKKEVEKEDDVEKDDKEEETEEKEEKKDDVEEAVIQPSDARNARGASVINKIREEEDVEEAVITKGQGSAMTYDRLKKVAPTVASKVSAIDWDQAMEKMMSEDDVEEAVISPSMTASSRYAKESKKEKEVDDEEEKEEKKVDKIEESIVRRAEQMVV